MAGDRDVSFSIIRTPVTIRIDEGPEGKRQLNIEAGEREPIHCYDARNITVIRTCESRWEITVTSPGGTTFAVITKEAPMMPTESHPRLEYFDIVEGRDSDEVE